MSLLRRVLTVAAVAAALAISTEIAAQGRWAGPEDPCEVKSGHFLVAGAVMYLQQAVQTRTPDGRAGRLSEARRVLYEALTTGGREQDPAAWYYLGRYFTILDDAEGADSAFARAEELAPICVEDINTYRSRLAPHRRRPPVFREKGGVQVQAAVGRCLQHRRGQESSVGGHDDDVGPERG